MQLKDLAIGAQVSDLHCYISTIEQRQTGKGKDYLTVTFKDSTGETRVNLWDANLSNFPFKSKNVVVLRGTVGEYQGKPQLNITGIDPSPRPLHEFGRVSTRPIEEMFCQLRDHHILGIKDPFIQYICSKLILAPEAKQMFCAAPAAKGVHHPWIGGLLEHVLGLCELADAVYRSHYHYYLPHLNMDKVKFGLMFHDWGKILEYDYSTPDIKYTMRGALQHHMGIVCDQLTRVHVRYEELHPEDTTRSRQVLHELLHIVYSHHGKPEWGSIMVPATPEALFVHQLDYMDAKMMHMQDLIASGVEGDIPGMSKYSYMEKAAYVLPKGN